MATAFLVAKRSKDPVSQVGACIVNNENKIVGTGYNGMPIGCSDDEFPWGKSDNPSDSKHFYGLYCTFITILHRTFTHLLYQVIFISL